MGDPHPCKKSTSLFLLGSFISVEHLKKAVSSEIARQARVDTELMNRMETGER
jgi:hypothetical protein